MSDWIFGTFLIKEEKMQRKKSMGLKSHFIWGKFVAMQLNTVYMPFYHFYSVIGS